MTRARSDLPYDHVATYDDVEVIIGPIVYDDPDFTYDGFLVDRKRRRRNRRLDDRRRSPRDRIARGSRR